VVGSKKKRSMLYDDDRIMLSSVSYGINNVVEAIRSTKVEEVYLELYNVVMYMPSFTDETLIDACYHLVGTSDDHLVLF
jgi:hypothetical protein